MAQIVPAILEKTKEDFREKESRVVKLPGVERIQVDFGDGEFVPNKMLPVTEIEPLNPAFHWEAHLMTSEPQDFLDYQIAGFKTVIVHYEAYKDKDDLNKALYNIKSLGLKNGVALNPDTPVSVLVDFKQVDEYLMMGVVPGYQGQAFLEPTNDRVRELRRLIPQALIEVDGGVNLENIKQVAQAGTDLIIVGSALVKAPDILEAYEKLTAEINII